MHARTGSNRIFYRNLTLTYTRSQCCARETVRKNMCEHSETIEREREGKGEGGEERERESQSTQCIRTGRQRDRETDRQTDGQTDGQTDRQKDR